MALIQPVQIKIGATLASSLGAAVSGAQAQLGRLGSTLAGLDKKRSGIKQLEGLRDQAKDTALAMRAAKHKVVGLEANLAAKGKGPNKKEARDLERARADADKAAENYRSQRAAVDALSASLAKAGVNTRAMGAESAWLGSQIETLRTRTVALARAQQSQANNLEKRSAYRAQMVDAVALGGTLYGLMKPAVAFESVMADVRKVVDFDTPQQFVQMGKDVLALSTRIPMAADGIGAIVAAAGQAGIARSELLRFAEDAAKMGVAFDLTGEQAGSSMAGMRTIFSLSQDQVVSLGDAINHLSNNMGAKANEMLNIAQRTGSTAKIFGLSGEQLNALGATFLKLKTPPEIAATGINALLMKLATSDKQNKNFQQGLQDIGLSANVMKKMVGKDAQGALVTFLSQVKKAPDVLGTLSDLFGLEYADDIAKLVGGIDIYKQAIGSVADKSAYAGSMQQEYEARAATTANTLQLLSNQTSRLGVTIGSALLPVLNDLVGSLAGPIGSVTRLAERFPVLTKLVVGTVAALIGAKIAAIGLGYAWTFVKAPILGAQIAFQSARAGLALLRIEAAAMSASTGLLSAAWSKIKGGVAGLVAPIRTAAMAFWSMLPAIGATTVALLANPITWIVVGIGAVVAVLALTIRKYWGPLAAFVGGVFKGINAALQPVVAGVVDALAPLAPLGNAIAYVFGGIARAVGSIVSWIGQLFTPLTQAEGEFTALSASGEALGQIIGTVLGAAFSALTFPIRMIIETVGWVIEKFQLLTSFSPMELFTTAWSPVADFFTSLWSGITDRVGQAIDWISGKIHSVANAGSAVGNWFSSAFSSKKKPPAPASTVGSAITASPSSVFKSALPQTPLSSAAQPLPVTRPGPVGGNTNLASSTAITVNVTASPGLDARQIAEMIETKLRTLLRDAQRRPATAMHD